MLNFPILFEFYFHGTFIVSGHIPVIMYCLLYVGICYKFRDLLAN
jgi:hypothetical protein